LLVASGGLPLVHTANQDLKCAAVRRLIAHLSGSRVLPVLWKSRSSRTHGQQRAEVDPLLSVRPLIDA
jgi:hypothetical protein